ncbi:MAG TPA: stage II sporulation protein M, partial [Phycisphaerae bacterium]|nr:stage II sporulation protein M [Phycisphaerae bacterium]
LVDQLHHSGAAGLGGAQVRELIFLYREASADLARLRALDAEPGVIRERDRTVVRAHGQVYGRRRRSHTSLRDFFLRDFPRLFRRRWPFTAVSLAIFLAFTGLGYFSVQSNPSVVADILGGAEWEFRGEKTGSGFRERFEQTPSPVLSSAVTTNNIVVALSAFALGVTFAAGTVYVLVVNGTMLGGFAGAYAQNHAAGDFWATVLVHGGLELSAIIIAGGAGLLMGYALWCPGRRTRLRALRDHAREGAQIALGLIPAFLVAGFFEGFITPSTLLSPAVKLALGLSAMLVFWLYLAVAGRGPDMAPTDDQDNATPALLR